MFFKTILLLVFCSLYNAKESASRELNFDEKPLYYEILGIVSLSLATQYIDHNFANEKERDDFFTQPLDDKVTTWLHGDVHKPKTTSHESDLDETSDYINHGLMLGAIASPFLKPSGHRLGTLMTVLHSQYIWFFLNRTLKVFAQRQRPKYHYTKDPKTSDTSSFPSGHAGQAFVMAFSMDYLLPLPTWGRFTIYSLAATSSVMRIAADRHFFSDTLAGAGVAWLGAWLAYTIFEKEPAYIKKEKDSQISFVVEPDRLKAVYRF